MAIEVASTIYELNQNLPLDADEQAEGDDHIRVIKAVLKATFPGLGGALGRVISKSIGFTPGVTENTCIFHCTAALTVSLPAVAGVPDGTYYLVNAFGGDLVIDPNGTELINGLSTVTVSSGGWVVVGKLGGAWVALVTALPSTATHAAPAKAAAADADEMMLVDSADSWKLKKLTVADLRTVLNGFGGAVTAESAGITDWNDARITKAGPCQYLVLGSAANGPGGIYSYYHVLNFEYAYKDGTGNCTQIAIPYGGVSGGTSRWHVRSRYDGTWSSWAAIPTTADLAGFAAASQAGVTSVNGNTGAVTAAQVAAAATAGYGYAPAGANRNFDWELVWSGATQGAVNLRDNYGSGLYLIMSANWNGSSWFWYATVTAIGQGATNYTTAMQAGYGNIIGVNGHYTNVSDRSEVRYVYKLTKLA